MSVIKKVSNFNLRVKLLGLIGFIAFFCISLISTIAYVKSKSALQELSINQLVSMGDIIKTRVDGYLTDSKNFTDKLAKDRLVEGLFLAYEGAFYGASLQIGKDVNHFTKQYKDLETIYSERMKKTLEDFRLGNILLVNIQGQVIYSTNVDEKANFLGRNLLSGLHKDTLLTQCFKDALASKEQKVFFSRFEFNNVTSNVYAYMCIKQLAEFDHLSEGIKKGDVMGVVATELDHKYINNMMTARNGMGQTGQAYIVSQAKELRSDFYLQKEKYNLLNALKSHLVIDTQAVTLALSGKKGQVEAMGPLGEHTLSSYVPIDFLGLPYALILEKNYSEVLAPVRDMILVVIMAAIVSFVCIMAFGYYSTNAIVKPIMNANEFLAKLAEDVTNSSQSMKNNSENLSKGATEIAGSIQKTASTMDELTSMVNQTFDNVRLSSDKSSQSQRAAELGQSSVSNMIQAMDKINGSNQDVVHEMNNIGAKMTEIINVINEIGTKTNVINDIVFQTKLLSFNASVEAARAGEHGKGFAVVAEEVGNLASASGQAAKEISEMLSESVHKVQAIVNESKDKIQNITQVGKEKVDVGMRTAEECGRALTQILDNVKEVNSKIEEIQHASQEQAQGIKDINNEMSQLDEISNQSKNIALETLKASEGLSKGASSLSQIVDDLSILVYGGNTSVQHHDKNQNRNLQKQKRYVETELEASLDDAISDDENVVDLHVKKQTPKTASTLPSRDDPRFQDI